MRSKKLEMAEEKPMVLAVSGSRTFDDWDEFSKIMRRWIKRYNGGKFPAELVTGGAKGADSLAMRWANENKIKLTVIRPDWNTYGKAAGILRNGDIVEACTHLVAFHKGICKGTRDAVEKAHRKGKLVYSFDCNPRVDDTEKIEEEQRAKRQKTLHSFLKKS